MTMPAAYNKQRLTRQMSPAQRVLKEDLTQELMEEGGFSREAAEALSVF